VTPNSPAIWGGCVPPAGGWRTFCRPGTTTITNLSWVQEQKLFLNFGLFQYF